jgi:DNA/RNA endonuclease G (NUC1)
VTASTVGGSDTEGARVLRRPRFTVEELGRRRGHRPDFLGVDLPELPLQPAREHEIWLHYTHFSVLLDRLRRLPRLTIVDIDGARWKHIPRAQGDVWSPDPRVEPNEQPDASFYQEPDPAFNPEHNDFAFGHMVRRQDPDWDPQDATGVAEQADIDTFHLTNTAPQAESLNSGTWNDLEDTILDDLKHNFRIKVVVLTGPILRHDDPKLHGAIPIPREFWKIAAWRDGSRIATAGWRQSQPDGILPAEVAGLPFSKKRSSVWLVPIADLATATGLDLGPYAMGDTYAARIRAAATETAGGLSLLHPRRAADLLMRAPEAPSFERLGITPEEAAATGAMLAYREREEAGTTPTEMAEIAAPDGAALAAAVSPRALDLIIGYETGGRAFYENYYKKRPVWPKGSSGITIGFGYDLGYVTFDQFRRDWAVLAEDQRRTLEQAIGHHSGQGADSQAAMQALLAAVRDVIVEWPIAEAVFKASTLPNFARKTYAALPNCDALNGDCFGALVSLTFNRGASYSKAHDPATDRLDRYREMRAVRSIMEARDFAKVPEQLRSMSRIWAGTDIETGMRRRRFDEAKLFAAGLAAQPLVAAAPRATTESGALSAAAVIPPEAETWRGPG